MRRHSETQRESLLGHAVVIGGSIAGIMAARVLANYGARVTIVDRDHFPNAIDFRRGAPQARHPHTLLLRAQRELDRYFPGITEDLLAGGAIPIDASTDIAFYAAGAWRTPRRHEDTMSIAVSRPLLEVTLRRRLADDPAIRIIQDHDVIGLSMDVVWRRVRGVRIRQRGRPDASTSTLAADLVVDASGRNSRAPAWLAELGLAPPAERRIDLFAGYSSRIYRRPTEGAENWKAMYIRPMPPFGTRGGMIIPMEGDRWHVALIGVGYDYPPTEEDEFMEFAQSLPTQRLYDTIKDAEALSPIYGFRGIANRVRYYDALPRYLEGFLVCGDSAYAPNPIHAQGMTLAVLGAPALDRSLAAHVRNGVGLSATFQRELRAAVTDVWRHITREDRRWPAVEVTETVPTPAPALYDMAYAQYAPASIIGGIG